MSRSKVIFTGVSWTIINNIVSILYGIVSVPFLINYFGKEEYGLIGIALSVNVYIQLLDMGMTNSNVRFWSEFIAKRERESVQKLFSLSYLLYFVLGLLNSIILFGLSFVVEDLFKITPDQAQTLRNLIWILALNATFSWISTCFDQFLRAYELIDWVKKRSILLKLFQFLMLAFTLIFNQSIEFYFFGYILLTTLILPLTIIKTKKVAPDLKFYFNFDKPIFKAVFPYAISIFSFSIFQFLALNSQSLILGNITGPGSVAEFNIMNTVASVVTVLSGSFLQVLLPIVTKMAVRFDQQGINRIIQDGTKYVTILLSFVIFMLIIVIDEIFELYVGHEYTRLSLWMNIWLLTLLLSHRNVMTSLVFTEKNIRSVAIMGAIAMILSISSSIIFVPIFGVGGVVIGFSIHEIIHTLFYYLYFFPTKFKINTKSVFLRSVLTTWILLGGVCLMSIIMLNNLSTPTLESAIIKTLISGTTMIMIIWYLLLNTKDKKLLKNIIS